MPKRKANNESAGPNTRPRIEPLEHSQDLNSNPESDVEMESSSVTATKPDFKLDKFLKAYFPKLCQSPKDPSHLIKKGLVSINGVKAVKAMAVVAVGSIVTVHLPKSSSNPFAKLAQTLGVVVHWENKDLAIVWKPSGVSIEGTAKNSLASLVPSICTPTIDSANNVIQFISSVDTPTAGLVLGTKNPTLNKTLLSMHKDGLISETWTVLTQGNVGSIRSLAQDETFELSTPINSLPAVSLCTFLESTRSRNFPTSFISTLLVSPIQDTAPIPLQALHHLSSTKHPVLTDHIALTGIDFEINGKTVSVYLDPPKKLKNLVKREQEAWALKRESDMKELVEGGIQLCEEVEVKLDAGFDNTGMPVPYILGKKTFHGLDFIVSPAVMIPKQGTEILIQSLLKKTHSQILGLIKSPHILDLGTGSGCILLTLLKSLQLPYSQGLGIDLSKDALDIAEKNAGVHGITGKRVTFGEVSFLGLPEYLATTYKLVTKQPFDYIVTNPPYLTSRLWDSDRLYAQQKQEPRIAVVSGEDGLEAYRQIHEGLRGAWKEGYLRVGTVAFVEVNNGELAKSVKEVFTNGQGKEGWDHVRTDSDAKGIERCVVFEWRVLG
ncbi:UNVERIFIED_CONTAM: hypothetical protein HDU68_008499 [Siphonaria sp. JEL0065]|nr:hypothetical protein HDU68_008499 [Siphonaria sp. JEL0065]